MKATIYEVIDRDRGFTLIELVTVLVLAGILAAAIGPNFFDNQIFRQRGYADELAGSLRYAQRVAIASSCNVQVQITAAAYSALQRNTLATCQTASAWNRSVLRSDGTTVTGAAPTGVATTAATFEFKSDGALTASSPPPVVIGAFTLTINPDSGFVTVQ